MNNEKTLLGLYIRDKYENSYDEMPELTIELAFVTVGAETGKIRNVTDGPLDGLNFANRTYLCRYSKEIGRYWDFYFDGYHPGYAKLEQAAKSLRKLSNGIDRMNAKEGFCTDFAQVAGRIAKVYKVDRFVRCVESRGQTYDESRHAIMDIGEGIDYIRNIEPRHEQFQKDRRDWVANDEGLYNWARSEGVRI